MRKNISFSYKGKKFKFDVEVCNSFKRFLGLMFKSKNTYPLLFEFKELTRMRIHSFFVFFSFVAVWLDEKNKIVGLRRVKPFTLSVFPKKPYRKLMEIPLNKKYAEKVKLLVGD